MPYNYVTGPDDFHLDANTNLNSIATYEYKGANVKGVFDAKSIATTVTAVAAYDYRSGFGYGDGDYGPVDFLRAYGANTLKTVTGELRFDTTYNAELSSLVGVFANHYTNDLEGTTTLVPFDLTVPSAQLPISCRRRYTARCSGSCVRTSNSPPASGSTTRPSTRPTPVSWLRSTAPTSGSRA